MMSRSTLAAVTVLVSIWGICAHASDAPSTTATKYWTDVYYGSLPVLESATPIPGSTHVPGDFDGNGVSDLILFDNNANGPSRLTVTMMQATVPGEDGDGVMPISERTIGVTKGYIVGAVGDLDGDGYSDLVFTSDNNDLWLWTNSRDGTFRSQQIYSYPRDWRLVGSGDVNGDGFDDLLWTNPNNCQFGYWLMRGGMRIGSKTFNVACGYFPAGIGYYTPSNRISILWTSFAKNDLYIWDSTGSGFHSYDLSSDIDFYHTLVIGGGVAGKGIGLESWGVIPDGSYGKMTGKGELYDRLFDAQGLQTGVSKTSTTWSGSSQVSDLQPAGYFMTTNATGLYFQGDHATNLQSGGLAGSNLATSGNAPNPNTDRYEVSYGITSDRVLGSGGYWTKAPEEIGTP